MDDVDLIPFQALRGVDRAQDQVVLVQQRWPGEVFGRRRWIEGQLADECDRRGIALGDPLQSLDVAHAQGVVCIVALEDGVV
jgi:hypothetical protein